MRNGWIEERGRYCWEGHTVGAWTALEARDAAQQVIVMTTTSCSSVV
jgi:hypothetical protein